MARTSSPTNRSPTLIDGFADTGTSAFAPTFICSFGVCTVTAAKVVGHGTSNRNLPRPSDGRIASTTARIGHLFRKEEHTSELQSRMRNSSAGLSLKKKLTGTQLGYYVNTQ